MPGDAKSEGSAGRAHAPPREQAEDSHRGREEDSTRRGNKRRRLSSRNDTYAIACRINLAMGGCDYIVPSEEGAARQAAGTSAGQAAGKAQSPVGDAADFGNTYAKIAEICRPFYNLASSSTDGVFGSSSRASFAIPPRLDDALDQADCTAGLSALLSNAGNDFGLEAAHKTEPSSGDDNERESASKVECGDDSSDTSPTTVIDKEELGDDKLTQLDSGHKATCVLEEARGSLCGGLCPPLRSVSPE